MDNHSVGIGSLAGIELGQSFPETEITEATETDYLYYLNKQVQSSERIYHSLIIVIVLLGAILGAHIIRNLRR